MSIELKGVNSLLTKLAKVSNIQARELIEEAGLLVVESVESKAKTFSDTEWRHVGIAKMRDYGNSCYVDIGLHQTNSDFEDYKGLWFHQWGYHNNGLGGRFKGKFINPHIMWFDEAVNTVEGQALQMVKKKVKAEIKAFKE